MVKMSKITVLVVEPQKKPYVKEIENALESLQCEVGGYIQAIYPFEEQVTLISDEESKLKGAPLNRAMRDDDGKVYNIIAGTFLVVGLTEDDFGSLSEGYRQRFNEFFKSPEVFINIGGSILVLPLV